MASSAKSKADAAAVAAAGRAWESMGRRLAELATQVGDLAQYLSGSWKGAAADAALATLRKFESSAEAASRTFEEIGQAVASQSGSLGSLLPFFEEASQQVKTELGKAIKSAAIALSRVPGGAEVEQLLAEAALRLASLPQ